VAPATANIIGKLAAGIADDMLSTVLMAVRGIPVLICPAMNTAMYENPIVQGNIEKLTALGYRFIEPRDSLLACGDLGKGAMADVETIVAEVKALLR
jgi:phosphopantothenoylcysteine decarboxylase/phosphopantothenoylcysteine decarboxylase/phosphopantothenate--cysteine ligase